MKYSNHLQQSRHHHQQPQTNYLSDSDQNSDSDSDQPQASHLMNTEMQRIKQQLKTVPYELILKQTNQNQQKVSQPKTPTLAKKLGKKIKKGSFEKSKKQFKDQAIEVDIHQKPKKKTPIIFQSQRKKGIDPRFQSYAGHYNQDLAMKTYNFIPKLQQAEIQQLKSKLKNPSKKSKLNVHDRQVLSKQYNRITNEYRKAELIQLEKQTKSQMKGRFGENYHVGKKQFKQEFEKNKLMSMSQGDREKKIKDKMEKVRRNQLNERRKTLHFKSK